MECVANLANEFCEKIYLRLLVHGLPVWVDSTCDFEDVEEVLTRDVGVVAAAFPPAAWQRVLARRFQVWVNEGFSFVGDEAECVRADGHCVHYDENWLFDHGNLVEKAYGMEIYEWDGYKNKPDLKQRQCALARELCHAYHYVVGFGQPDIAAAYHSTMSSKGAYACANEVEFFASVSVVYHGFTNDCFPFTRNDLEGGFDDEVLAMLRKVWGLPWLQHACVDRSLALREQGAALALRLLDGLGGEDPQPPRWRPALAEPPFAVAGSEGRFFRLLPADGSGRSLDIVEGHGRGRAPGAHIPALFPARNVTGMMWRLEAAAERSSGSGDRNIAVKGGCYRLSTAWLGPEVCLAVVGAGGKLAMRLRAAEDASQCWRLEPVGPSEGAAGGYRLVTEFVGAPICLACLPGVDRRGLRAQRVGQGGLEVWALSDWAPEL